MNDSEQSIVNQKIVCYMPILNNRKNSLYQAMSLLSANIWKSRLVYKETKNKNRCKFKVYNNSLALQGFLNFRN